MVERTWNLHFRFLEAENQLVPVDGQQGVITQGCNLPLIVKVVKPFNKWFKLKYLIMGDQDNNYNALTHPTKLSDNLIFL